MQIIEQMLTGQIPMLEFTQALQTDSSLQKTIRQLVPPAARNNPTHIFWNKVSYSALAQYDFDYLVFLLSLSHFDETLGDNLNIFSLIKIAYEYFRPDINYTTLYSEAHSAYLDAVGDSYEGPEVTSLLNQIVIDALSIKPKSRRTKLLRKKLKEAFHVIDNKRPYWIQGGEWPMGQKSPMQYTGRNRIPDGVCFVFRDVDTNEIRTIDQYY